MPVDYYPALAAIRKLTALRDGWDSHGGIAPTHESMDAARRAVYALREHPPQVVPTSTGGVQFEWHEGGVEFEIEFGPDGEQVFDEKERNERA